jgi:C4-type Zn-finger protein
MVKMVSQEFLNRLAEEEKNKRYSSEITCPYCEHVQDTETKYSYVSYWGEDSEVKIDCENCDKEFWVKEIVERNFETTTIEWQDKEEKRIAKIGEVEKENGKINN